MNKRKLLIRLTSLILFIFFVNLIAKKFYWYSTLWWFDMPMHFLGGFWLALAFIWVFSLKDKTFNSIFKIVLGVVFIGICWELFEFFFVNYVADNAFNTLDTISDMMFDLAGGLAGILYCFKKIIINPENKIQL
jgi:uncharacterized BrkB/YihY/UPF0761 family membrane protein